MKAALLDSKTLRPWTRVRPWTNVFWLLGDYAAGALISGLAIWFWLNRADWGLHWGWNIAVGIPAVILMGSVQHRIGLMGHEASHYMLFPKRYKNDLLAELLCFFPLFGTLTQYRAKHLSHHLYPNDPDRDANMGGTRASKLYSRFPMPKSSFIYHYYVKFFWPPFVFYNLFDLLNVITIGSGLSPIPGDERNEAGEQAYRPRYQNATIWGLAYLGLFIASMHLVKPYGVTALAATLGGLYVVALIVWRLMPNAWFMRPGGKLAYSLKFSGFMRLTFCSVLFAALGIAHAVTGIWVGGFFLLLWILPLIYVFPYMMLLREIYQHANAGMGDITNSRVIRADPFTQWALLGYGNEVHLVHHIYPNIPHYHLDEAHRKMVDDCPEYRDHAEETYGTFSTAEGRRSLLDSLAADRSAAASK